MSQSRSQDGKYRKSGKAFYIGLIAFLLALGGTLYHFGGKQGTEAVVGPSSTSTEQVAERDSRLQALLDDETNKKIYELQMTKRLILQDRADEEKLTAENTKTINEERDQKLKDEQKRSESIKLKLKLKMDDVLKQELSMASTSKTSLQ